MQDHNVTFFRAAGAASPRASVTGGNVGYAPHFGTFKNQLSAKEKIFCRFDLLFVKVLVSFRYDWWFAAQPAHAGWPGGSAGSGARGQLAASDGTITQKGGDAVLGMRFSASADATTTLTL